MIVKSHRSSIFLFAEYPYETARWHSSNFKTNGPAAFQDRYILLIGGGQYYNATKFGPRHFFPAFGNSSMIPNGVCGVKKAALSAECNYWGYLIRTMRY